jgi:hypothetical protein
VHVVHATPVPSLNADAVETIGWPTLAQQVAAVARRHPDAAVFAANYGEAGAIARYGPALGVERVYSGHNGFADWGRPPDSVRQAVVVGLDDPWLDEHAFRHCTLAAHVDNGVRIDNEEQGRLIRVCEVRRTWTDLWPSLTHLDA